MSAGEGGVCRYTHDVSGERFDDLDGATWTCDRPAVAGGHCAFHAPVTAVDDATVRERFLEALSEPGPLGLVGARLSRLDLDYTTVAGPSNHPIDLREATVEGPLSLRHATVERPLRLDGATLSGLVDFEDTELARRVECGDSTFEARVSFRMADFRSWLDLRRAEFCDPVYARVARFRRGIYGVDATFRAAADFLNSRFDDVANFYRARFESGAVFDSTTFAGNAQFVEATLESPAVRLESATGSPRSQPERMTGTALSMSGVTCEREVRLTDATLCGDASIVDSDLGRGVAATGLVAEAPVVVDCTGSGVVAGEVGGGDGGGGTGTGGTAPVSYDLTGATVGDLRLTGRLALDALRFEDTTFEGFDFANHKRALAARGWRLHTPDTDRSPEHLETLYLRAKNGANRVGATRAAAEFFVKELRHRRRGHRRRIRHGSGRGRLSAAADWVANATLQATCGYGERPFRPLLFSGVLVVLFAVVFGTLDAPIAYDGPGGYLIFSIETFVALVLGLPAVTGTLLGFLLALEAFFGAFAIALFVFTLTRSVSR